ncbi:MAG: magnesium transporter [Firmicutes bacterium]|nr:magnesium transporter [Bacillota bacterium]
MSAVSTPNGKETELNRIKELLDRKDLPGLLDFLSGLSIPDLADLLMLLAPSARVAVFRLLPKEISSEVFAYLESSHMNTLLRDLTDQETQHLLANMRPDDRTALFEELPGRAIQRLLNLLSPEDRKEALSLLGYPEESVGRFMTPDYIAVRPHWTVAQALEHIRARGTDSETIYNIYVTDDSWRLLDDIELRRLILADPAEKIERLMDHVFISLNALEDREQAVRTMERYDVFALPVVDAEGILLGIVTADDVLDVSREEATEDFHKSAAVTPLRTSYHEANAFSLFTSRIGWLVSLVFINLLSSGVIAFFEKTLASAIALAFFMPLLIDSGGNAGSQSATLVVRALATGEIRLSQWIKVLFREILVGVMLGMVMGLASGLLGVFRGGYRVGLVVGVSMVAIIILANLVGVLLPFLLTRFKLDPAVASSPLITSIADCMGLFIYFSIAHWLLGLP